MKFRLLIIFLFAALFFQRCHNKYYNYPSIAYDIKDRDFKELDEEYKNVRKYKNANLESFVEKIGLIDPSDELIQSKLTSRTVLQCFVDEEGKIETVFILEHSRLGDFDLSYDMLAVHALLQSKFKPVKIDSKNVKYFIIVNYPVYEGLPLNPRINGISTENIISKGKFILDVSSTNNKNETKTKIKQDNIYEYKQLNVRPLIVHSVRPIYPDIARKKRIKGTVVVNIIIDENGKVIDAEVVKSTDSVLEHSAINAAMQFQFKPSYLNGKPVKVKMPLLFHYNLK